MDVVGGRLYEADLTAAHPRIFGRIAAATFASTLREPSMPLTCPIGLDTARLRVEVQATYERVARAPDGSFHFHRGPHYAATRLGYDATELASLPTEVTASFAGVGNPHVIAPMTSGVTVLDMGCGAGTDLLLAARRVGPGGRAIGIDMTSAMLSVAAAGAASCDLNHVDTRLGDATDLPVDAGAVDILISNGVLNLVPDKPRALGEMWRVLRPGGRVQLADITIGVALSEAAMRDIDLWAG
jgi:SAM-dependent methyltransferase